MDCCQHYCWRTPTLWLRAPLVTLVLVGQEQMFQRAAPRNFHHQSICGSTDHPQAWLFGQRYFDLEAPLKQGSWPAYPRRCATEELHTPPSLFPTFVLSWRAGCTQTSWSLCDLVFGFAWAVRGGEARACTTSEYEPTPQNVSNRSGHVLCRHTLR